MVQIRRQKESKRYGDDGSWCEKKEKVNERKKQSGHEPQQPGKKVIQTKPHEER